METDSFCSKLLISQVQEAHGLQEEETAAHDQETTLSAPPSDTAQGQLRENLLHAWNCRRHHLLSYTRQPHQPFITQPNFGVKH